MHRPLQALRIYAARVRLADVNMRNDLGIEERERGGGGGGGVGQLSPWSAPPRGPGKARICARIPRSDDFLINPGGHRDHHTEVFEHARFFFFFLMRRSL